MKLFVIGSLNMDLTVKVPFLPKKGMTIEGEGLLSNAGGKGANQAVACAKLGGKAYMVGCVGEPFGEELLGALERYGVDAKYTRKECISSGVAIILVENGDNRIVLDRGANGKVSFEDVDRALREAERGDFLIVQLEIDPKVVVYALKEGKRRGMITLFNPAPARELPKEAFENSDFVLPNQTEAEFYTGIYPESEESILKCAGAFEALGAKRVLITLGERGSVCVRGKQADFADAFPVTPTDTTAAGDTYVGAFAVKLSEGAPLPEAMRFASAASALAVTRAGAQQSIPSREEVEAFLRTRG